jgi:anaerobic ribonucleoside-triphosphate reductase
MMDLEGIGERDLDINYYSKKFFSQNGPAADKTIDANANVDDTSVATWEKESVKPIHKLDALYMMWLSALQVSNVKRANRLVEGEIAGWYRIMDLHRWPVAYCYAADLQPLVMEGMPFYKKIRIGAIKHFDSFIDVTLQYVAYMSNQIAGACALPNLFPYAEYFIRKDYGENWMENKEIVTHICQRFQSFIYGLNFNWRSNQCVKEDTEVLTPAGFKKHYELSAGDDIYVWQDGALAVEKVQKVNVYDYNGEMHEYSGRDLVETVTPEHRVFKQKNNSMEHELMASKNLFKLKSPINIPVASEDYHAPDYPIDDDMLALLTVVLCDGYISDDHPVVIAKSTRKTESLAFVEELLKRYGIEYSIKNQKSHFKGSNAHQPEGCTQEYSVAVITLRKHASDVIRSYLKNKKVVPDFFLKLSRRQAKLVLKTWAAFDGHAKWETAAGKIKLQCDNAAIQDAMQHVAALAGYGSRVTERRIGNNTNPTRYLFVYKRSHKMCMRRKVIHYKGKVWCPTTKAGIVMFRENGRVYFSGNSPFSNLSIHDDEWLKSTFSGHVNPDYSGPNFDNLKKVQRLFVDEMLRNLKDNPFTFPVMTACMLYDKETREFKDKDFADWIADVSKDTGLFNFYIGSDTAMLSSCCRLRSNLKEAVEYTNSFGVGGVGVGSHRVVTINLPQIAYLTQDWDAFQKLLVHRVELAQDILDLHRATLKKLIADGYQPLYRYKFMFLERQFSTVGFIGLYEALELQGLDITTKAGAARADEILKIINDMNDKRRQQTGFIYNMEQVPGESAAVNLAAKDRLQFENSKYEMYSNQYIPLTKEVGMHDRIAAQGRYDSLVSGGAILHLNLDEAITKTQLLKLLRYSAAKGVIYFAVNLALSRCKSCGKTFTGRLEVSPCHAAQMDCFLRIVGYLTPVSSWAAARREEYKHRQFYKNGHFD